jgi:cellobiose epimerase
MRPCAVLLVTAFLLPGQDLKSYIPKPERNLKENIIPFSLNKSIDEVNGGYIINHNAAGEPRPDGSKGIVTQSRQVWLFSRLAREDYSPKETLAAAGHGYRFLPRQVVGQEERRLLLGSGCHGAKQIRPGKQLYGESFALYALSEYYLASKDKIALDLANELFRLMETKAYDREFGGYRESFNADWTDAPTTEPHYMGSR